MAVITKIVWLKENIPEIVGPQALFLDMHSWIQVKLGIGPVVDRTLASGTMLFDITSMEWDPELLAYAGVAERALPRCRPAGALLGPPSTEAAAELGLARAAQVQIVTGAMDQACNAVGSGTVLPGGVVCSIGTVEAVTIVLDPAVHPQRLIDLNMPIVPSAIGGQFMAHVLLWDAGRSLSWFCANFARKEEEEAAARNLSVYEELLSGEPRARNVFYLPHLSGSGMPWQDPTSRGAFLGLTTTTDVVSVAHAIIEGLTFELKLNLDAMESVGMPLNELRVVGGGSKSDRWLQLKADVLGKPISRLEFGEAGCLGAAILAGYGCGLLDDPVAASRRIARSAESFRPSAEGVDLYRRKYAIYRRIYPTLQDLNREISRLTS